MGLLLRLCDSFCAADNMLGLFGILKEAATQVLALEHCRRASSRRSSTRRATPRLGWQ